MDSIDHDKVQADIEALFKKMDAAAESQKDLLDRVSRTTGADFTHLREMIDGKEAEVVEEVPKVRGAVDPTLVGAWVQQTQPLEGDIEKRVVKLRSDGTFIYNVNVVEKISGRRLKVERYVATGIWGADTQVLDLLGTSKGVEGTFREAPKDYQWKDKEFKEEFMLQGLRNKAYWKYRPFRRATVSRQASMSSVAGPRTPRGPKTPRASPHSRTRSLSASKPTGALFAGAHIGVSRNTTGPAAKKQEGTSPGRPVRQGSSRALAAKGDAARQGKRPEPVQTTDSKDKNAATEQPSSVKAPPNTAARSAARRGRGALKGARTGPGRGSRRRPGAAQPPLPGARSGPKRGERGRQSTQTPLRGRGQVDRKAEEKTDEPEEAVSEDQPGEQEHDSEEPSEEDDSDEEVPPPPPTDSDSDSAEEEEVVEEQQPESEPEEEIEEEPDLSEFWIKVESRSRPGEYYWWNKVSKKTSWKTPNDLIKWREVPAQGKDGYYYFWNTETGETTWEVPEEYIPAE